MAIISTNVPNCPICGSPAALVDCQTSKGTLYTVMCTNAEQCGLGSGFVTDQQVALQLWENQKSYAKRVKQERRDEA